MEQRIDYDELDAALRRCGSTWDVATVHGLLCSRLAAEGAEAGQGWLLQVLEGVDNSHAQRPECEELLDSVYASSYRQLEERQSGFLLLLPEDDTPATVRTAALAHWCEGFLHGLVSGQRDEAVREVLSKEPLADLIKDLLQITRADAEEDADDDDTEAAYVELVEYVRVAAQLAYEQLSDVRNGEPAADDSADRLH